MAVRSVIPVVVPALVLCGAWLVPAMLPQPAASQSRTELSNLIPQDAAVKIHARIRSIDPATRRVTLDGRSGRSITLVAGPNVRLEMLKEGDAVDAQYYRSVAFFVSQPGMKVPEDEINQVITRPTEAPGGIAMQVTRVSGLVVGIDLTARSVDLVNPQGGAVFTVNVLDPDRQARLPDLKVGDTITAVVSEALAVSIQPSKGLF